MDIQRVFNSRIGVGTGLALGQAISPKLGYTLSGWGVRLLSKRRSFSTVQAVRINQWIIRGGQLTPQELDSVVLEVLTHAGHCFIDLYHNLRNPEGIKSLVVIDQLARKFINLSLDPSFGAFIVAPHMSNFDLCLLGLAHSGLHGQVLTYGQPPGGYQIQNDIRAKTGLEITPVSPEVHERAIENMRQGGFVITAVDRPIRSKAHYLNFFGHPSPLPAGHIRMAIQAGVPVIVASASMDQDSFYHIHFSDPIPMQTDEDAETEIRINGEAILKVIEARIRKNPGQWLMYYPAWPDVKVSFE
jgi:lauroyl/myristoyl acyltransferase